MNFQTRILFVLSFIFLLSGNMQAQNSGFHFSLSSGPSVPVGNFKKTSFEDGSFALTGVCFSFDAGYQAFNKIGLGLKLNVNFHPVDVSALIDAELNRDPFLIDLNIRSEPYRSFQLMAGASYRTSIGEKLRWNAGIYAGFCRANSPYKLYEAEYFLLGENTFRITSATDIKPSALLGSQLEYMLKPYFSISAGAEYSYTPIEFGFITAQSKRTEKHDFMFINLMLGFSVYL